MLRSGKRKPPFTVTLAGLCLLLARGGLAEEGPPLPEGSIARLGRGEIWVKSALSADGKRLAAGSKYGVWLRDGHTGAEIARLEGERGRDPEDPGLLPGRVHSGWRRRRRFAPVVGRGERRLQGHP